jgi:hypothetical protein
MAIETPSNEDNPRPTPIGRLLPTGTLDLSPYSLHV